MTLLWTTPREWETNEPITKEKLNAISDNLSYLMQPSHGLATVRGTASDLSITATSPTDLDPANYALSVELSGVRPVVVELQGEGHTAALTNLWRLDVRIDGTTYVSSLTGTELTHGLWEAQTYVANAPIMAKIRVIIPAGILSAGVHTFQPRAWVSAGTLTWRMGAGYFSQFLVGEL